MILDELLRYFGFYLFLQSFIHSNKPLSCIFDRNHELEYNILLGYSEFFCSIIQGKKLKPELASHGLLSSTLMETIN